MIMNNLNIYSLEEALNTFWAINEFILKLELTIDFSYCMYPVNSYMYIDNSASGAFKSRAIKKN